MKHREHEELCEGYPGDQPERDAKDGLDLAKGDIHDTDIGGAREGTELERDDHQSGSTFPVYF